MRLASRRSALPANTPTSADCVVIVFARAPRAGQVKTRIARRIGDAAAARLHERLVCLALASARAARCGPVELHVSERHSSFRRSRVPIRLQRGADLGSRMHYTLSRALRCHARAVLIGSDCPALTPAAIARAARWLQGGADIVLAPAQDGGYALIGARRISAEVFSAVEWGSERVLAQTRANVARARLSVRYLPSVWDVDRPEDLERLRSLRLALAARGGKPRMPKASTTRRRARAADTSRKGRREGGACYTSRASRRRSSG